MCKEGIGIKMEEKKEKKKDTFFRLIKLMFSYDKGLLYLVMFCIVISAIAGMAQSIFLQMLIDNCIIPALGVGLSAVYTKIVIYIAVMASIFLLGLIANFVYTRLMAIIGQGFLKRFRRDIFEKMQRLPIKFFDTHTHGDIMSYYTNDIDTLRQFISQSLPQLLTSIITTSALFVLMLYYSLWLTLLVVVGVVGMLFMTKKVGGNSAKYFMRQQMSLGKTEGFVEEVMHGQKVIKVFCHEAETQLQFEKINNQLYDDSNNAHKYANILMPLMGNMGNILYVALAFLGGALVLAKATNVSLAGTNLLTIGIIISFLTMSKMFTNAIAQVSQQINSVVMALAGADRLFSLLDQTPEVDGGYVTLVNAITDENGNITESENYTGAWAWRHPHSADGAVTYVPLKGAIVFDDVDFGYNGDKLVLHGVTLYAKPGQKIAFVGSTGAGKTTITNLINRFYDIADGKIRYDGININKIKKDDLRKSLGIVLQDTNLFTGTVLENIRYGKLDATDDECIAAAKLANADDFILRLPNGYDTMLTADGGNLSQGQRQLISIARAAVCNAPVMILDEATSSIDTRTEILVQNGTDKLMQGRTVFVIAHRLSTVRNADLIVVLEHGKIIEKGSHNQLLEKKGQYYQLYTGAFELE